MNRDTEDSLLQFCLAQRTNFDAARWKACLHPDREELAAATLFLAGVDWYGHKAELLHVAESLLPANSGGLAALVSRTGFDLSRFSNMLRRRLQHAPAAS